MTTINTKVKNIVIYVIFGYICISGIFVTYHFKGWEFYINYDHGVVLFWEWFWLIIYTTIIYNCFRIYDFVKNTPESQQQKFKKIYFYVVGILTILFLPVILHYLISISNDFWARQGYADESTTNIFIRVIKTIVGAIIGSCFDTFEAIRQFIVDALEESGYTVPNPYGGERVPVAKVPFLSHFLAGGLITMAIKHRKVILETTKFLYKVTLWLKRVLFGDTDIMSKGIVRATVSKLSWLKRLLFFLIGIEVKKKDTSRGTAAWATKTQTADIISNKETGLLVDGVQRISWKDSMNHFGVFAPSGKGKTSNFAIPNVLGITEFINPASGTSPSIVITDPKGEIFETTSTYLQKQGYTIKVIHVEEPLRSEHFNPVKRATSDKEIAKLAQILVGAGISDSKNNNNDFWGQSAQMLLTLAIKIVKRSNVPENLQNLHNIRRFIDLMGGNGKPMAIFVKDHCKDDQAITEYASFIQQDQETLSNIILSVKAILKDLSIREIAQLTANDTIDFELLRKEKTAIFIITPFSDIEYYRFFLTILYSQLFAYCDKNAKGNDIVFLLDEFGNLGKIPSFEKLITTLRSKRCSVSIIVQDVEQIRKVYGDSDAKTILNGGCATKIFFGGIQNLHTLKEVSQMLGNQTLEQKNKEGKDMGTIARPLMMPDEISRMPMGTAILLSSGKLPVKLKLQKFDDTYLKNRLYIDEFKDYVAAPLPKHKDVRVEYFPFDNYIDNVVED